MSYKKNIVPTALAILLHVVILGLLLWNFAFEPDEAPKQFVDAPVQAKLVTAPETPKKDATNLKRKQEQQKKQEQERLKREQEQKRQQQLEREKAQELERQKEQKQAEQEKLEQQKLAKQQEADKVAKQKAEEEKKRLAAEAEKKRKAEEAKKKAEAEAKKKKLEEEKRKKAEAEKKRKEAERKKREEAERKLRELEEQMASLDDELFEADKGDVRQTQIMNEVEKYRAAIGAKVKRYWYIPESAGSCVVSFSIGPGGIILDIADNGGDIEYCESGITAIKKAVPLPVSDDPEVMKVLKDAVIKFDPSFKQ